MSDAENERKLHILKAAEKLFARNSFHGTRVEDIAAAAKVNKATIYYYFKSKQAVLDYLIEDFLTSFVTHMQHMFKNIDLGLYSQSLSTADDMVRINDEQGVRHLLGVMGQWVDILLAFFEEKRDTLRIMFAESMMEGENRRLLFRLSDMIAAGGETFPEQFQQIGIEKLSQGTVIIKFFAGILPLAYYAVCADEWCTHYKMKKEALHKGVLMMFHMEIMGYFLYMKEEAERGQGPADPSA